MFASIPADLQKPLLDEFRQGWNREMVLGRVEAKKASALAKNYHRGVDGLGRLRARIPASSFHFWGKKIGYKCWEDQAFIREYLKTNELEVKGGKTNLSVGYGKSTTDGSLSILDAFGRPTS